VFMAVCPNCGEENPDRARLCMMCGTNFGAEPTPQIEERKVVSVLFVDLVGFTARSHDADPEDVRAALAPYHRLLKTEIERFGGTVEKFIGDAVMAVFGAPVTHEDDAERAVRAALRITEAIQELNDATPHLDLSIRAAVNSGEGLVALGARPQAGEGMVTGDVVNTASRLQGVAPVGGVAVGEITYRSTKDFISYEPLDPVTVKGKPEPIPVWRAVSARSRFGVDVNIAPKTPFIGRDFDLGALKNAYQRTLREASVQLVTITGEPGVGKTRLLGEFSSFIDDQDELVYWRQGRSLPYGEGVTFWALGEIVKAQAGILESDSPNTASDKLQAAVTAVVEEADERTWFVARLGPLVGAKASQSGSAEKEESFTAWRRFLEAIASRGPLVVVFEDLHWADAAMLEFIDHLVEWSTGVPLLVVCTARPELYESHQGWGGGKRNSNSISLSPLSDSETAQLISGLLAQAVLPAEVHSALLERAGGNPLYAEEFIRMLSDRGILLRKKRVLTIDSDAAIPMPDNVQALIAARLDTLSAERKALLHDASVAGKVFWSGAVAALGERDDREVREGLHELARKELVRPARGSSMEGQQEYSFWHALVRDVAYGQIPRATRSAKHRAMAEWIEAMAGDRITDHAEVLVHHYSQALALARRLNHRAELPALQASTRRFLIMAGDRGGVLDPGKADYFYTRALELDFANPSERGRVIVGLAEARVHLGRFTEAQAGFEQAAQIFCVAEDARGEGKALIELSHLLWERGLPSEHRASLDRAVARLESVELSCELCDAYTHLGESLVLRGEAEAALPILDKALHQATVLDSLPSIARALTYRGVARCQLDDFNGIDDMQESLRLSQELGDVFWTIINYINLTDEIWRVESPGNALKVIDKAVYLANERGHKSILSWARASSAAILFDDGAWDEAFARANEAVEWDHNQGGTQLGPMVLPLRSLILLYRRKLNYRVPSSIAFVDRAREIGEPQVVVHALAIGALIAQMQSESEVAVGLIRELDSFTRDLAAWRSRQLPTVLRVLVAAGKIEEAERFASGIDVTATRDRTCVLTGKAILAEAKGQIEEAHDVYEKAAQGWLEYGLVLEEGQAHLGLARCLIALGDREAATDPLHKARAIFERLGAVPLINETDSYLQAEAAS